ncbi:MAG: hypothetical protein HGB03_00980 [Candidatus Yonathbacteria bacterium]|nr:hypothetical protein [Candidatus Yonathbacteria bacterium]NTW47837.1 hypothetical protein [Candidatus Yonathbacteria bacterium]
MSSTVETLIFLHGSGMLPSENRDMFMLLVLGEDPNATVPCLRKETFSGDDAYNKAYGAFEKSLEDDSVRTFLCKAFAITPGLTIRQMLAEKANATHLLSKNILSFDEPTFFIVEGTKLPLQVFEISADSPIEKAEKSLFGKGDNPRGFIFCVTMLSSDMQKRETPDEDDAFALFGDNILNMDDIHPYGIGVHD